MGVSRLITAVDCLNAMQNSRYLYNAVENITEEEQQRDRKEEWNKEHGIKLNLTERRK